MALGSVQGQDLADGSVVNSLHRFAFGVFVAITEARYHGQALFLGFLTSRHDRTDARRIHGNRFLGKYMLVSVDRRPEVEGAKVGRRREDYDINGTGEDLLVGIPTDEAMIFLHVYFLCNGFLVSQFRKAALKMVGKEIPHGNQFNVWIRTESLRGGARAPPAAADQADAQRVAAA